MSMYGIAFGRNLIAPYILEALELPQSAVGRFRDAFVADGEFAVYTRNGGGNREHYSYEGQEEGEDCFCTGCIITYHLPKHPNYLRDKDDDFDSTYATVYFSIPEKYKEVFEPFDTGKFDPDARWFELFDRLRAGL